MFFRIYAFLKALSPLFDPKIPFRGGGIRGREGYRGYMGGYQGKGL
jgi:hypothetical protein